ncbi:MAG: sodium:solute symporter family protein [Paludibacteraceae bacterium]|nr:sodium:solute symporter family protein [Paludibacteraceae bacterium]
MDNFVMYLIVMVYFLALAFLGYLGYKKTNDSKDFLIGGGEMNPIVMALSYGATFISASAIVGFGGVAATFGMGIQWLMFLNMFVGVVVAFIIFGRPTRRLGVKLKSSTFAQFLGSFYNSDKIRVFVAAVIFIFMPLYAAAVLRGGVFCMQEVFGIDFDLALLVFTIIVASYVIAGGMKGVMYTDALQAVIMFVCMAFILFGVYKALGMGFSEANQALEAMKDKVPEKLAAVGHQGWTAMPRWGSQQWYTLVTSFIMGVGIGCLAQPQLVVRFLTVSSTKKLNQGVVVGCVFLLVTVGVIYHVGALSNLYFFQNDGKISVAMVEATDKIIPYFIDRVMPSWFVTIFMLCILSASMSTLSAQFHTMAAAAGADIYGVFAGNDEAKRNKTTLMIRLGVLVSILISFIICFVLGEKSDSPIIAISTSLFMGICASSFLPAYFCALYWKKVTKQGAYASMWVGVVVTILLLLFIHAKEATALGVCKSLFGTDVLITDGMMRFIDPIMFAFPLSCITIVVVSLMTKNKAVDAK